MIPAVAQSGLAEWCDVFCENGVFTPEESREILMAAAIGGHEAAASMPTSSPPAADRASPRKSAPARRTT